MELRVVYIKRINNVVADALSRGKLDRFGDLQLLQFQGFQICF